MADKPTLREVEVREGYDKVKIPSDCWTPEVDGFTLEGKITEIVEHEEFENIVNATIVDADGNEWLTPSQMILSQLLEDCEVGDEVIIDWIGEKETKSGNIMNLYVLQRKPGKK